MPVELKSPHLQHPGRDALRTQRGARTGPRAPRYVIRQAGVCQRGIRTLFASTKINGPFPRPKGPNTGPPRNQTRRPPDSKANETLAGTRDDKRRGRRVAFQCGKRRPSPFTDGCGAQASAFPPQGRDASGQGGQQESFSGFKYTPDQRPPSC